MPRRLVASVVAALVAASCPACSSDGGGGERASCSAEATTTVDLVTSPEKTRLLEDLADRFNRSADARPSDGRCTQIVVHTLSSSEAEARLLQGWPDGDDAGDDLPPPVVWAPDSSTWAALLDRHLGEAQRPPMASDLTPVARTPVVIAMPRPLAEALGWPDRPVGFDQLVQLGRADLDPPCDGDDAPAGLGVTVEAWCDEGWGDFRLAKTNPFLSTSGLGALVAQAHAATSTSDRGLSAADFRSPRVDERLRVGEASVVHYGDSPLAFLENLYRNDVDGRSGRDADPYVSAAVVEEKSVIDYNRGDPQGTLGPGETGDGPPREQLVALYPEEGTFFSDNPLVVLDAPWADADEQAAARRFVRYMRSSAVQERLLDYGFRPAEPGVRPEGPLFSLDDYGVDPAAAAAVAELPVPDAEMLDFLREQWLDQRRRARVQLVVDVSGPLDPVADAVTDALDLLGADDEIGLGDVVPVSPLSDVAEILPAAIGDLRPSATSGDPYVATQQAYESAAFAYDPDRINAVVLLTDDPDDDNADDAELDDLLDTLTDETQRTRPIRIFTIAYGPDADSDADALRQIAEATNAASYDAPTPAALPRTLLDVMSNF